MSVYVTGLADFFQCFSLVVFFDISWVVDCHSLIMVVFLSTYSLQLHLIFNVSHQMRQLVMRGGGSDLLKVPILLLHYYTACSKLSCVTWLETNLKRKNFTSRRRQAMIVLALRGIVCAVDGTKLLGKTNQWRINRRDG